MQDPKISVLMPVYNGEKYLRQAIDSILNQTFTAFEFLVVDDGSTDTSVEIVKSYNDPRIRLIRNEQNAGISETLNKGIQLAKTNLVARMDADDISYPERLQRQYDFMEGNPEVALLSAWTREVNQSGEPVLTEKFPVEFYYYMLTFQCWIYHPSVMFRRDAVMDVGMYSSPYSEDYDLWWNVSRKYKIANLPEVLLDYRHTDTSLCKVTKKIEYELHQHQQVRRNIRYYAGHDFELEDAEVACLQYNCYPLLEKNSVQAIITCLGKLKYISNCIRAKENVNLVPEEIDRAARFLEDTILGFFAGKLPAKDYAALLFYLGYWGRLLRHSGGTALRKAKGLWQ